MNFCCIDSLFTFISMETNLFLVSSVGISLFHFTCINIKVTFFVVSLQIYLASSDFVLGVQLLKLLYVHVA